MDVKTQVTDPAVESAPPAARPPGSSDSLLLARRARASRPLAVVCASALDAQRLADEIRWFDPALSVALFPDWETLPYDSFSPHQDLVSERLATLYRTSRGECDVVLVPASTALYRLSPASYLAAHTFFVKAGEPLDVERLREQLGVAGYEHVTQVVAPGEFCVRGGIVDLFPMGSALPYRIDLAHDEIESIRTFDPDTQRTVYTVSEIRLLPAREFPIDEAGRTGFRQRFRETFEGDASKISLYRDVSSGIAPAGIEYFLPLFFDTTATFFDYLRRGTTVALHGDVAQAIEAFWKDAQGRHKMLAGDRSRPVLPPRDLFLSAERFYVALRDFTRIDVPPKHGDTLASDLPDVAVERRAPDPLHRLKAFLATSGLRVLVAAESPGRRETIAEYFAEYGVAATPCAGFEQFRAVDAPLMLGVAPLDSGFAYAGEGWAIVTEGELYAGTARVRGRRDAAKRGTVEGVLKDLSELRPGDPVVHLEHGVGRYRGLTRLDLGEGTTEFLQLEYAEDAKLYVPVAQLHLVTRYTGGPAEQAPLHKLGSGDWEKAKRKAAEKVRDTAAELLHLYAQRAARKGHAFKIAAHDLEAFADGFGFEETPDQAATINAVIEDLRAGKPMDRVVCGDVGFGKTEVALRAAFVAVADGKQVAVLAPTTLLAEQHFDTFSDRFADWGVRIAELSRFRTAKESAEVLKLLAEGKTDIVVGTHKLLSKSTQFARLGLVIIDEEHRFGVRQKEALKALRAEVDVLTLTATPIPRTLAMSMEGLRDLSVITTAPAKRLAIKTFVTNYSPAVIREACLRELKRGGQVFFLHNEVETIESMREKLEKLVPEARIGVAHGQMPERELERVMRQFVQQKFNLLVCSTIIETGIDIPSANTILINRADKFGLAQLHQLRGRVGRSHHQAYAYLLTPPEEALTPAAKKRLEAIQMMEELGSGFFLAMHDLEIRGAGEVLGESQSGEMQQVGFALYADMLNHAVKALKSGRAPDLTQPFGVETEVNLHLPALLPDDYCADIHERLVLYKRFANCASDAAVTELQEELIDRFGQLPDAARALVASHRLRVLGKPLGMARLDATAESVQIQFEEKPNVDPARIIELVQKRGWKLAGPTKLRIEAKSETLAERFETARRALELLRGGQGGAAAAPAAIAGALRAC